MGNCFAKKAQKTQTKIITTTHENLSNTLDQLNDIKDQLKEVKTNLNNSQNVSNTLVNNHSNIEETNVVDEPYRLANDDDRFGGS